MGRLIKEAFKIEKVIEVVKEKIKKDYEKHRVLQQLLLQDPIILTILNENNKPASTFSIQFAEGDNCLRITQDGVFYSSKQTNAEEVCLYTQDTMHEILKSCSEKEIMDSAPEYYIRKLRVLIKCEKNNEKYIGKEYTIYYKSANKSTINPNLFMEAIRILKYFFDSVKVPLNALISTYYVEGEEQSVLLDTRSMQEIWIYPFIGIDANIIDYRLESIYHRSGIKTCVTTLKYRSDNVKDPGFCKVVNTAVSFEKLK